MKKVKIKSIIRRTEKINVYDISVENNHNFFANGILSHNCHNYGTKRLLPYVKKKCKYKIGLTATLQRMDNNHYKLMEIFDYEVFKYTPQQALFEGVLNPFKFFNISVELDFDSRERYDILTQKINTLLQAGGGFKKIMRGSSGMKRKMLSKMNERKDLVNNYSRKFDVVKTICKKHITDKIIIFNEYNKQTSRSYFYLLDIGVRACVVHSGLTKQKRDDALSGFQRDKYNVLLASKVLDEGFNLPKLDVAIIAAGNSTSRQTIQRMGRVLRRKKHASMLYQVFCKNTIEEGYSANRASLFKELCSDYKEYHFDVTGEVVL